MTHTVSVMYPPVTIHDFVPELHIFLALISNHADTDESMLAEHRQPNN